MKTTQIKTEQHEKVAALLTELAPYLTSNNKKDIEAKANMSRPTLKRYLTGDIVDIETGIGILNMCRAIINKRKAELEAA